MHPALKGSQSTSPMHFNSLTVIFMFKMRHLSLLCKEIQGRVFSWKIIVLVCATVLYSSLQSYFGFYFWKVSLLLFSLSLLNEKKEPKTKLKKSLKTNQIIENTHVHALRAVLSFLELPVCMGTLHKRHWRQVEEWQHAQKLILLPIKTGPGLHSEAVLLLISNKPILFSPVIMH